MEETSRSTSPEPTMTSISSVAAAAAPSTTPSVMYSAINKGKSVVWNHIVMAEDGNKATCRHCSSEFAIKGGTSAVLRHLKGVHAAEIENDPGAYKPTVRRRMKTGIASTKKDDVPTPEDLVTTLLQHWKAEPDADEGKENDAGVVVKTETDQRELNDLLEMFVQSTSQSVPEDVSVRYVPNGTNGARSSAEPTRKRPAAEASVTPGPAPDKAKRYQTSMASRASPPALVQNGFGAGISMYPGDEEIRELTKRSLQATIEREEAMTQYYRMKTKYVEMQIQTNR